MHFIHPGSLVTFSTLPPIKSLCLNVSLPLTLKHQMLSDQSFRRQSQQRVSICIVMTLLIKTDGPRAALLSITCLITPAMMKESRGNLVIAKSPNAILVWSSASRLPGSDRGEVLGFNAPLYQFKGHILSHIFSGKGDPECLDGFSMFAGANMKLYDKGFLRDTSDAF